MNKPDDLKPCPFCNSPARRLSGFGKPRVDCSSFKCPMNGVAIQVNAWEDRPAQQAVEPDGLTDQSGHGKGHDPEKVDAYMNTSGPNSWQGFDYGFKAGAAEAEAAAVARDAASKPDIEPDGFVAIADKHPPVSMELLFFHPEWVCEDFNPTGVRVGFWNCNGDPTDWTSAYWYDQQDTYLTVYEKPTHWAYQTPGPQQAAEPASKPR